MSNIFNNIYNGLKNIGNRIVATSVSYESAEKTYGIDGEETFSDVISQLLPKAKIFKNVFILEQNRVVAEIDMILILDNKIFAVEVKSYKGYIYEENGKFFQEKENFDEIIEINHSPFKQINRSVYLLKEMLQENRFWVNEIVYFIGSDAVQISSYSNWYNNIDDFVRYVLYEGKTSNPNIINYVEKNLICCDEVIGKGFNKRLHDRIIRENIGLINKEGKSILINLNDVKDIFVIKHGLSKDVLKVNMKNGDSIECISKDTKIKVKDYKGEITEYMFSKIDSIHLY